MALVKTKPTSAGRRSMVKVVNADLHKGAPYAPLVEALYSGAPRARIASEVTFEDGRKGRIQADLEIRDVPAVAPHAAPLRQAAE